MRTIDSSNYSFLDRQVVTSLYIWKPRLYVEILTHMECQQLIHSFVFRGIYNGLGIKQGCAEIKCFRGINK